MVPPQPNPTQPSPSPHYPPFPITTSRHLLQLLSLIWNNFLNHFLLIYTLEELRKYQFEKKIMDYCNLLCDEDWLESTTSPIVHDYPTHNNMRSLEDTNNSCMVSFYTTKEECQNAFMVCLEKEVSYMPESGYVQHLRSSDCFLDDRTRAIQWFIKAHTRLNLSLEAVFNAANYLDRFISMNYCNKQEPWTIELLSRVCVSIAAKFGDVSSTPILQELHQMDDLNRSYKPGTLQRMELAVLQALEWRLGCVTAYSYLELLNCHLESLQPDLHQTVTSRVIELLLGAVSDPKFIQFRPSTIAVSALRCSLEEQLPSKSDFYLSDVSSLIPRDQMSDINNCHKIMEEQVAYPVSNAVTCGSYYLPSSPATVLEATVLEATDMYNCDMNIQSNTKKRQRDEDMLCNSRNRHSVGVLFRD